MLILLYFRYNNADNKHMYKRFLDLPKALAKKSHFLLGPRATGKSWLIKNQLKEAQIFNLLDSDTFGRFLKRPAALGEEITSNLVVIDEVQKLPILLDEVHRLIEERKITFLLTGSSARKLKHGGANLLAGRARSISLFPLTSNELTDFDLLKYCNFGGLPIVYQSSEPWLELRDYVNLYLREEIIQEALVRKFDHYARFLDVVGISSGEELNYQQIASDSGVPVRTVSNFIEVLKDTLLAFELAPYTKSKKRKSISRSKIYLFDVGVANFLAGRKSLLFRSESFGKAFEHFIIQEIRAYLSYSNSDLQMFYWRTLRGDAEVDCILGNDLAIEVKSSEQFQERMLSGLLALKEEKKVKRFMLITREKIKRKVCEIEVIPYDQFLKMLWRNELF